MTRTGRPPRPARARRYADLVCRYATNLMLAAAIIAAYAA